MTKINDYEFENNGIVVRFVPVLPEEEEIPQRYNFVVLKGQEDLTARLQSSVRNTEVIEYNVLAAANALFGIIENNLFFDSYPNENETNALLVRFKTLKGKDPDFRAISSTSTGRLLCLVEIINAGDFVIGRGKDRESAEANALKKFFQKRQKKNL